MPYAELVTAEDLAPLVDQPDQWSAIHAAAQIVNGLIYGYTRRRYLPLEGEPVPPELRAIALTAALRLARNLAQEPVRHYSQNDAIERHEGAFTGRTLPEQAILHRYRRRAA